MDVTLGKGCLAPETFIYQELVSLSPFSLFPCLPPQASIRAQDLSDTLLFFFFFFFPLGTHDRAVLFGRNDPQQRQAHSHLWRRVDLVVVCTIALDPPLFPFSRNPLPTTVASLNVLVSSPILCYVCALPISGDTSPLQCCARRKRRDLPASQPAPHATTLTFEILTSNGFPSSRTRNDEKTVSCNAV
jgi:hypothetical protein